MGLKKVHYRSELWVLGRKTLCGAEIRTTVSVVISFFSSPIGNVTGDALDELVSDIVYFRHRCTPRVDLCRSCVEVVLQKIDKSERDLAMALLGNIDW